MARSNSDDYEFSLFPFMGVLAGVIGTLVLVISGLAIIGMSQSTFTVSLEGNPQNRLPLCVECANDRVIIHDEDGRRVIQEFASDDSELLSLLEDMKDGRDSRYLVLLIRPDAIETFAQVERIVLEFDIEYGFDALLSEEKVRISS